VGYIAVPTIVSVTESGSMVWGATKSYGVHYGVLLQFRYRFVSYALFPLSCVDNLRALEQLVGSGSKKNSSKKKESESKTKKEEGK
jgi:hypothetical protein